LLVAYNNGVIKYSFVLLRAVILAALLFTFHGSIAQADPPASDIPNFHTVAPGIYRGGAPTEKGLVDIKAMGVKTVIDLRISPRLVKVEKAQAARLGIRWINLPMGSDPPTRTDVAIFIAALRQAPSQPVFVHCQHGADRTGCMIGIWRETQQGWPFAQTFAEMRRYGFQTRWVKLVAAVQQRARA
jgi:protein tyrosine/serine phosphatase